MAPQWGATFPNPNDHLGLLHQRAHMFIANLAIRGLQGERRDHRDTHRDEPQWMYSIGNPTG